ncbi:MAG: sugar ABC transporter permease [Deltaproteobacteria bacterium]|nr:sugar ABC transporter permease [Deltaproteobacteria bacterium]
MSQRIPNILLSLLTAIFAITWIFPVYWAIATSIKHEVDVTSKNTEIVPTSMTLIEYVRVFKESNILTWYINSLGTSILITLLVILISMMCGYALSQLNFPGKRVLWWMVLASIMVPTTALVIALFVLIADFNLINTWAGIILPQIISPVCVVVFKQFFDAVPRELREAAILDGAKEHNLLLNLYFPMSFGITAALAIVTYIGAWNQFWWPFIMTTQEEKFTVTIAISSVQDAFGVRYAREMALAVLAGFPVAAAYLVFQKKVTNALMMTSGIKG